MQCLCKYSSYILPEAVRSILASGLRYLATLLLEPPVTTGGDPGALGALCRTRGEARVASDGAEHADRWMDADEKSSKT